MLLGPVFDREVAIEPRRVRMYAARAAYVGVLLLLVCTAWLVLTGTQEVRALGDIARFASSAFQFLAPFQLALAVFFSAMFATSAVAQEKDKKTFVLLLLTNLSNVELVLGKLLASLLSVLVMFAAGLPVFMLLALLGGVSFGQIARVFAVTVASIIACGSLGSTLALWREKTFQALALFVLVLVLWLALGELLAYGALGTRLAGLPAIDWAIAVSPWQAILAAGRPFTDTSHSQSLPGSPVEWFLAVATAIGLALNGLAIARVRAWNATQADERQVPAEDGVEDRPAVRAEKSAVQKPYRAVWDNPVLWREVRTWAYGRKILIVRITYLALFTLCVASLWPILLQGATVSLSFASLVLLPLMLLSLVLVNAQAVTALTAERDARALDLLLVTDLTPNEFVFGKLGGILYNTKEMVLLPVLLCAGLWWQGLIENDDFIYLLAGLAVLVAFVAMLGLHAGMIYENSRSAIAVSLGTVFFLFVGVATCMRIMVAFSGSFHAQFGPFAAFVLGGGIGLYTALGARNPSQAIFWASFGCPFATFYAITSFLRVDGNNIYVFLPIAAAYGFMMVAMLIPAIYEFDLTTGRTMVD